MATRIRMSDIERCIMERIFLSENGIEPIEDLLEATGADRHQFVDALQSLEAGGYLSVANLGESIVVTRQDPVHELTAGAPRACVSQRVGQC